VSPWGISILYKDFEPQTTGCLERCQKCTGILTAHIRPALHQSKLRARSHEKLCPLYKRYSRFGLIA